MVSAGVGSNPIRYQIFLITFDLAIELGGLDLSSIQLLKFFSIPVLYLV